MDDLSGKLSIKEVLNTTNKRYFKLIVDALDQGNSPLLSQTSVEVTVLDTSNSAPRIKPTLTPNPSNSFASISEYADVGAAVAHIGVEDLDSGRNGDVDCFLLNADSMFQLNKYATNEYKVTVDKSLDRETKPSHDVTITCTDKGVPPLSTMYSFEVRVSDENDNAPMFRQQRYFVNFNENNEIGDQIVIVSAFDMDSGNNSKLTFYLDARSQSYAFINERTGEILANRKFDKEAPDGQGLSLTVYARDQGNPVLSGSASVLVTIQDVNDEKPVFDQAHFRFWIDENRPADETVGKLSATDKDLGSNAVTRFTMKPNGSNIPFVVIEDGSIKTNRELDREDRAQYTFEVMAIDIGNEALFSTATVTVFVSDMNDNSPVVTFPRSGNSTVYVQYLTAPQTVVCRVLAEDKDDPNTANGRMRYSLTTMNSTNFFSIDASNGNVILKAPLENTNSIGKTYILNIQVTDQGNGTHYVQSTLHVVIVSDNGTQALTEEPSKNFVIVVVVSVATVLISVAIIVTICIIRRFDRSRRGITKGHQKVMTDSMYARNNEEVDNIFPADACEVEKKKKGVHFNIEGQSGIQGHVDCQIAQNNDDHGNHSFDHLVLRGRLLYGLHY
ncbi:hypothetical protein DPMN_103223 [Dreissena polymorpha]|uniref:Cadherin domain-containing protein n=1 Tax=Dreissena polymorpha TaxID=45954 RepID=A0A9D4H5Q1_DREPO|nr:hypothetical protein DPMN_103223 [Dreissena polymorpha]